MGLTSIWHWLVVLAIVVLVFGTKKLRHIGRDLGGAVHDFKEGLDKGTAADKNGDDIIEHRAADTASGRDADKSA